MSTERTELLRGALGLDAGQMPFPWQVRLLDTFVEDKLPRALDVPTGLGKTATMAIWLVARALGAEVPRRLIYVVDRRAVVDQATTEAERLRQWVRETPAVAEALGLTGHCTEDPEAGALAISTLRGQFVDNREWMDDPSQPGIVVGTVDMVGSRLLFEGYGSSAKIRPYQAGLLGNDCLYVVDEAHLVPSFEALLDTVVGDDLRTTAALEVVPACHLLSLSATSRDPGGGETFKLLPVAERRADDDYTEMDRRLDAPKRIAVHPLTAKDALPTALARQAWQLAEEGARAIRCVVFVNSRDDAEKVHKELTALAKPSKRGDPEAASVTLFTGGRRVHERELAATELATHGFIAGTTVPLVRPAFLVSTSAGEVGVDLDAEHMVSDLVAWDRMVQRLGRVNRRGRGDATVDVLAQPPDGKSDDRSAAFAAQLQVVASLRQTEADPQRRDGSPNGLRELSERAQSDPTLRDWLAKATSATVLYPDLEMPTLEAWAMTALPEHAGRPEVEPWLRGWDERLPQTRVVWRAHLPFPDGAPAGGADEVEDILRRYFDALPPHLSETLELDTYRVVSWLSDRIKRLQKRLAKKDEPERWRDRPVAVLLDARNEVERKWLTLDQLAMVMSWKNKAAKERIFYDKTLVVTAQLGGLSQGLLDSSEDAPPATADVHAPWSHNGTEPVTGFRVRHYTTSDDTPLNETAPAGDWYERERFALAYADDAVSEWLIVDKWRADATTEDDRAVGRAQELDEHHAWTARQAEGLAKRLGLPDHAKLILTTAARLHDEGKRAPHWQQAFSTPDASKVWAKTLGPVRPGLLQRYRHELGSLDYAEDDQQLQSMPPNDRALVMHLIAAHHGFARPFLRTDGHAALPPSALEARVKAVARNFFALQRQWGPWGLAWWEALLRAADQRASKENDATKSREEAPRG